MNRDRLQLLMEIAMAVALSAVLHFVRLYQMPQGGTVSLEMLPIFVIAFRRGLGAGVATGALFGLVDIVLEPIIAHPVQAVLDYPLAMGLVGTAGIFRPVWRRFWTAGQQEGGVSKVTLGLLLGITPGVVLGASLRFVSHFISGIVFFASYAPKGQPVWLYSLLYNGSYVAASAAACLVLMWVLAPALERVVPTGRPAGRGMDGNERFA